MSSQACGLCAFLKEGVDRKTRKPKETHLLQGGKFCSNKKSIQFRNTISSLFGSCSEFVRGNL